LLQQQEQQLVQLLEMLQVAHDETQQVQSCIDSGKEEEEQKGVPVVERLQLGASFVEEDMKKQSGGGNEDEGKA